MHFYASFRITSSSSFRDLLLGDKQSCLAISEPFAGSDVSAIRMTAEKSADGTFYTVNGVKKWITEGNVL